MNVEQWLGNDNTLGIDIWKKKYQYENETFEEWLDRVSGRDEEVKDLIKQKKFLFGGRILANRGLEKTGRKITMSNCYVISPPEDNIESIYEVASKLARTYSYGGGCGIDISKLSPKGAKINNAAKATSGAVSFMDTYSQVTDQIGQEGRRGALMISIDCHHPDLEDFIDIKTDLNKVTKANISVRVTNDFMNAVKNNEDFTLSFTRNETGEKIEKVVNAREIFEKLTKNNWDFAEPGCLFWDRICNYNLLANTKEFEYAGVNPCAEEPLPAGGSCLLGSINLSEFVNEDKTFNYDDLKHTVKIAVHALNDVLDEGLPLHPLEEQRKSVRDWRQIGLGIMGLADMLIKMEITYGSPESITLCDQIGAFIADTAMRQSARLAKEHGSFPKCNKFEITSTDFFNQNAEKKTKELTIEYGLRNSQLLTIAPTGTLSTMIRVSGGIEPIFANSYERKTESLHGEDVYYKVYTPIVDQYIKQHNLVNESELPNFFVTAQNLNYKSRIEMQSVWQKHIDASISSTVNVPNNFTIDEVFDLYVLAWEKGLKGVTIYRDGCKRSGILSIHGHDENDDENILKRGDVIHVQDNLIGLKRKLMTGCGSLHCTAFFDPATGDLMETYLSKGSTGGCLNSLTGLSRMISLASRGGLKIHQIVDQLDSCGVCPSYAVRTATKHDTSSGACCPSAIGRAILDMHKQIMNNVINYDPSIEQYDKQDYNNNECKCPECGEPIIQEGGCVLCRNCGWSKCN